MQYRRKHISGSEAELHEMVCDYLRVRYPRALFRTDFASGLRMTMGQAIKHKRLQSGRAWPDLFIAEPGLYYSTEGSVETYYGLFLELKKDGSRVYLKDGSLSIDPHIQEQAAVLKRLRQRGYRAEFVVGFKDARALIDEYLGAAEGDIEEDSPY